MSSDDEQGNDLISQIDVKVQKAVEGVTNEKEKHKAVLYELQSCINDGIPFNVVSEWFERYQQEKSNG